MFIVKEIFIKIDELLTESTEENLNLKYFENHIIERYVKKNIKSNIC